MTMSPVVHFELPAKDKQRASEFYSKIFGWKMIFLGPEMNDYVTAQTTETNPGGLPEQRGVINGGFFQYSQLEGYNSPTVVIRVEDMTASMKAIKQAGGKIVFGPQAIPGVGIYATMVDSEDNRVALLQQLVVME